MDTKLNEGVVKMFNTKKGYGFIHNEDGNDIFFHYSNIVSDEEFKSLKVNDKVTYTIEETERGKRAINVTKVE